MSAVLEQVAGQTVAMTFLLPKLHAPPPVPPLLPEDVPEDA